MVVSSREGARRRVRRAPDQHASDRARSRLPRRTVRRGEHVRARPMLRVVGLGERRWLRDAGRLGGRRRRDPDRSGFRDASGDSAAESATAGASSERRRQRRFRTTAGQRRLRDDDVRRLDAVRVLLRPGRHVDEPLRVRLELVACDSRDDCPFATNYCCANSGGLNCGDSCVVQTACTTDKDCPGAAPGSCKPNVILGRYGSCQ